MTTSNMLPRHIVALFFGLGLAAVATAANRTWIGGNADWNSSNANWSPANEPDPGDVAIFNTSNSVNLANSFEQILGLTMSGGISLSTNGNGLSVNGLIQLSDVSTDLVVGGTSSVLTADAITINSGAEVTVSGAQMGVYGQSGVGLLDVNAGGELSGNGLILLADSVGPGVQLLDLDGTLTAHSTSAGDLLSLAFATLTITVSDIDGVIDLDGNSGNSIINVSRNDTLSINGGVFDGAYSGTINLSAGSTFSRNVAWSFDGTLNANTGGSTAATVSGAAFMQTGGSINVDAGETLRFSSVFDGEVGAIVNNGLIIFDNDASIDTSSQFQTGAQGSIEVNAHTTILDQGWDWDGNGGSDNVITIGPNGTLDALFTADDEWDGLMNINGGYLVVATSDGAWGQASGTINLSGTALVDSLSTFIKTGGTLHVLPGANAFIDADSTWTGGTQDIDGILRLFGAAGATFNGAPFTGDGTLIVQANTTVAASTTIDVNTFDWDGISVGHVHTINGGVIFTINSPNFDADDDDMDDAILLQGHFPQLIVNGPAQWTMNNTLTLDGGIQGFIGGTSRMVLAGMLDANMHTTVSAPVTFASGSIADVESGYILDISSADTRYDGALITGGGIYIPGSTNLVQSSSTINAAAFGFDHGSWTINPGATLTVNVDVYDINDGTFDQTINVHSGVINVNTGDAQFVLNGGTIYLNNNTGVSPTWTGEPLAIGDDAGASGTANLNVTGNGISRINSIITFNSDADVNIAASANLVLNTTATFASVNGANNANFTGNGTLTTNGNVVFNDATTMNMFGGTVDFDGENGDSTGNRLDVDAPLVINAAIVEGFGAIKTTGSDILDVDNKFAAGSLTVNLTNPNAEWTLDAPGRMFLINDNTNAVLLAGSDVNINGQLDVGGEVQTNARIDLGGTVSIATAGEPFWLNGGNNTDDPNTMTGGFIFGPGVLAASDGHALHGFGQITAPIDFDGAANVLAQGGTLYLVGAIQDVGTLGTAASSGILDVVNPWNTNVTDLVQLNGGELRGAVITNGGAAGINGFGLVSARVVNSTRIDAEAGTLVVETSANDNDWDGPVGTGSLNAISGDLEIRDDATFPFTGTASASAGRTLFAIDFELEFEPGSTLSLADGARYRSTNGTHLGGAAIVTGGTASLETDATAVFENGSTVTLTGNLRLENPLTIVEAGASFAGGGTLNNASGRTLQLLDGANVGVLIKNQGTLELGASAGQVQGLDFQQDTAGLLEIELAGTGLNDFDRMTLIGQALLAGELNVSLLDGFSPVAGNAFSFLSAVGGVSGTFDTVSLPALAAGLSWSINYNPTNVQLSVIQALAGDFNGDGTVNAADYVVWRKNFGTQASYDTWRANFGHTAGSGAALPSANPLSAAVPEPSAVVLMVLAAAGWCFLRCRAA